jgi:hypothetical protein
MRFFTPERYLRLGNLADEAAFLAAQDDWERAIADYRRHLQQIRDRLPAGLRRLIESVSLHDARVVDMVSGKRGRLTITLQPETPPSQRIVLTYSLIEPPAIDETALPEEALSQPTEWLYDELDVQAGAEPTFRHDILLSNGWEVSLRFRGVTVSRPRPLIPSLPERSLAV